MPCGWCCFAKSLQGSAGYRVVALKRGSVGGVAAAVFSYRRAARARELRLDTQNVARQKRNKGSRGSFQQESGR